MKIQDGEITLGKITADSFEGGVIENDDVSVFFENLSAHPSADNLVIYTQNAVLVSPIS